MAFSLIFTLVLLISLLGARNLISYNLTRLIGNYRLALVVYSLIFLPGVIIHEMSHFLTAAILGVRTGSISFFPEEISRDNQQRLGSVQIASTGLIRSSLIGVAPLVFGSLIIIAIAHFQFPQIFQSLLLKDQILSQLLLQGKIVLSKPLNFLFVYIIFCISNTMFISPSDRKSLPALFVLFGLLAILAIFLGLAPQISKILHPLLLTSLNFLSAAFFFSLFIDLIIILPLIGLRTLLKW